MVTKGERRCGINLELGITGYTWLNKVDNQQGPTGEFYLLFCNNINGKESEKE